MTDEILPTSEVREMAERAEVFTTPSEAREVFDDLPRLAASHEALRRKVVETVGEYGDALARWDPPPDYDASPKDAAEAAKELAAARTQLRKLLSELRPDDRPEGDGE